MMRVPLLSSLALVLGGLVVVYLYQEQFRLERSGGPAVEVVTATQDIPFGEPIRAEWLGTKTLPRDYVEERHLLANNLRDLLGMPLAQSVRAGEAIMRTDLSPFSDHQRTLSGEVPQGGRAITVLATSTSAFNGLLRPGDHVDLVLTIGDPLHAEGWHNTLLLENVAVLAVGRVLQEEETEEGRRGYRLGQTTSVTLEVTFEQGAMITQAQQDGRLQLLLRNGSDVTERGSRLELVSADIDDPTRRERFLYRGPRRPSMVIDPPVGTAATGTVAPAAPQGATSP
jgi:pilus assembly protein CpaB